MDRRSKSHFFKLPRFPFLFFFFSSSSLGAAIASGKLDIVKWFVDHGASVTSRSSMGCTPMIIASQGNGGA